MKSKKTKVNITVDDTVNVRPVPKHELNEVLKRRAKMLADYRKEINVKYK